MEGLPDRACRRPMTLALLVTCIAASRCVDSGEKDCRPIVAYDVDEERGCIDFSPAGEVVIGCTGPDSVHLPLYICYRHKQTGQLLFSFNIYPDADPQWEEVTGCPYGTDDFC